MTVTPGGLGCVVAGLLTLALLGSCSRPAPPVRVSVAEAQRGDLELHLVGLGVISPLSVVAVRPLVSGSLQNVRFSEGQLVHEGELLAQIDPSSYEAALHQAEGRVKASEALLARLEMQHPAREPPGSPQANIGQYIAALDSARAAVVSGNAALIDARLKLSYSRVTAPVTGRIGLRQVDAGNYVTAGDENPIAVITRLQPISAVFVLPQVDAEQISARIARGPPLPVIAWERSHRAQLAEGTLLSIDNQIDMTTGGVKLRATFDNKDGALFPNQFVTIELMLDTLHNQLLIPASAVHRGAPGGVHGDFVYVVDRKTSTVSERAVTVGAAGGQKDAISRGLSAGEWVVAAGRELHEGDRVQLQGLPGA